MQIFLVVLAVARLRREAVHVKTLGRDGDLAAFFVELLMMEHAAGGDGGIRGVARTAGCAYGLAFDDGAATLVQMHVAVVVVVVVVGTQVVRPRQFHTVRGRGEGFGRRSGRIPARRCVHRDGGKALFLHVRH